MSGILIVGVTDIITTTSDTPGESQALLAVKAAAEHAFRIEEMSIQINGIGLAGEATIELYETTNDGTTGGPLIPAKPNNDPETVQTTALSGLWAVDPTKGTLLERQIVLLGDIVLKTFQSVFDTLLHENLRRCIFITPPDAVALPLICMFKGEE
jgi:hypothetical protein